MDAGTPRTPRHSQAPVPPAILHLLLLPSHHHPPTAVPPSASTHRRPPRWPSPGPPRSPRGPPPVPPPLASAPRPPSGAPPPPCRHADVRSSQQPCSAHVESPRNSAAMVPPHLRCCSAASRPLSAARACPSRASTCSRSASCASSAASACSSKSVTSHCSSEACVRARVRCGCSMRVRSQRDRDQRKRDTTKGGHCHRAAPCSQGPTRLVPQRLDVVALAPCSHVHRWRGLPSGTRQTRSQLRTFRLQIGHLQRRESLRNIDKTPPLCCCAGHVAPQSESRDIHRQRECLMNIHHAFAFYQPLQRPGCMLCCVGPLLKFPARRPLGLRRFPDRAVDLGAPLLILHKGPRQRSIGVRPGAPAGADARLRSPGTHPGDLRLQLFHADVLLFEQSRDALELLRTRPGGRDEAFYTTASSAAARAGRSRAPSLTYNSRELYMKRRTCDRGEGRREARRAPSPRIHLCARFPRPDCDCPSPKRGTHHLDDKELKMQSVAWMKRRWRRTEATASARERPHRHQCVRLRPGDVSRVRPDSCNAV